MATAIVSTLAISTTALAGLADQGTGGSFNSATYGNYAYGWRNGTDLIWQVEVYVAATDDGVIDKTKMSLTSVMADGNIAYVGTLLYTDGITGNIIMQSKSYVSDKLSGVSTEPVFYEISPYQRVTYYSLPESTAYYNKNAPFFNESRDTLTYSTNFGDRTMYVLRKEPCGLPTSISGSYNYATTKAVIESDEFIELVVENLKSSMDID